MHKTWNVRDQTDKELEARLQEHYKLIEKDYNLLKKMPDYESAKKLLDDVYRRRAWISILQSEQIRRMYNGTSNANE